MSNEIDVLIKVCDRLENNNIKYMVTGSIATSYYAVPRMTRDIDIVVELSLPDVDKLFDLFSDEFYIDKDMIMQAIGNYSMFNTIDLESMTKIDFIVRKESVYRKEEFQRRRSVKLGSSGIKIVSPEDLIISKLDWAKDSQSEFQLKDVRNIMTSVKDLDMLYLEGWIDKLGLRKIYEQVGL